MTFRAFYPGRCETCGKAFLTGATVEYNSDGQIQHAGCEPDLGNVAREDTIGWDTVTAETIDRQNLLAREQIRYGPLVRPACQGCFLELPASGVCGQCQ